MQHIGVEQNHMTWIIHCLMAVTNMVVFDIYACISTVRIVETMVKTILVTGATGSVGLETLKELLRRDHQYQVQVISLDTRFDRKVLKPYLDRIKVFWGDLRDAEFVHKAITGVDAVIHTGAVIPPQADHDPKLAWQVNVGGTQNVLAAMKEQNPASKLIYTSSISVYGDRVKNPQIRVGDQLQPSLGDEYAKTKIEAEGLIQNSGLRWTILRLCGILTSRLRIQPLMFHMPLDTALEWCHASDAGYALVQAIECENVIGRIFNLGGGKQCRIQAGDFLRDMFPIFGLAPSVIPEHAFATENFHSGDYIDGDELNRLLGFRRKTLRDYYTAVHNRIPPIQRLLTRLVPKKWVRAYLERKSEPLRAVRKGDVDLIRRYYGSQAG